MKKDLNLKFYTKKFQILKGENIDELICNYQNNFEFLQNKTDYIQWLFPIYSQGKNPIAHPLQLHELEVIFYLIIK